MEELVKFTLLTRDTAPYLVDRHSERKETGEDLIRRVNQNALSGGAATRWHALPRLWQSVRFSLRLIERWRGYHVRRRLEP